MITRSLVYAHFLERVIGKWEVKILRKSGFLWDAILEVSVDVDCWQQPLETNTYCNVTAQCRDLNLDESKMPVNWKSGWRFRTLPSLEITHSLCAVQQKSLQSDFEYNSEHLQKINSPAFLKTIYFEWSCLNDDCLSSVTETKAFGNLQKLGQLNWLCHASVVTTETYQDCSNTIRRLYRFHRFIKSVPDDSVVQTLIIFKCVLNIQCCFYAQKFRFYGSKQVFWISKMTGICWLPHFLRFINLPNNSISICLAAEHSTTRNLVSSFLEYLRSPTVKESMLEVPFKSFWVVYDVVRSKSVK